jgi:hypothetical protein
MGTLTIKTRNLSTQADYVNEQSGLTINLNYTQNAQTYDVLSINGTIYKTADMSYAGSFSGQPQGGEMEYSISGVKSKDMAKVFAALTDIEQLISGENNA